MPPPQRRPAAPQRPATPAQAIRRGLRVDEGIMQFEFRPTIGVSARAVDKLGVDIRSFREPLRRVVQQVMAPSFMENFAQGGRPDKWEPLSDATHEIRERTGGRPSRQVLVRTGALRRYISQLNAWTITPETATIRDLPEKVWYGKVHQAGFGGSGVGTSMKARLKAADGDAKQALRDLDDDLIMAMRTGKKVPGAGKGARAIPARPFVLIQEDDYEKIEEVFVRWLEERVAASKLGIKAHGF